MRRLVAALSLAACAHRPCDLSGEWRPVDQPGHRYRIVDDGDTVTVTPLAAAGYTMSGPHATLSSEAAAYLDAEGCRAEPSGHAPAIAADLAAFVATGRRSPDLEPLRHDR